MEVNVLTVHWHDNNEPIYSVHLQPNSKGNASLRLATGGGDNNVRIWRITYKDSTPNVRYLSTLSKHTQAVNVVRFDPKGEMLATAGDDGTVFIWRLSDSIVQEFGQDPDDEFEESWVLRHACRSGTSEIYDLAWSPDSRYLITGSTDNVSRIFDARTGLQVSQIAEHSHFVQGVAWDPLSNFLATQSADRSVHIYSLNYNSSVQEPPHPTPAIFFKISRAELPSRFQSVESSSNDREKIEVITTEQNSNERSVNLSTEPSSVYLRSPSPSVLPAVRLQHSPRLNFNSMKSSMLYHTENLESFFRRLTFSPDGNFLLTPSGIFKNSTSSDDAKDELLNTVYIYSRSGFNKPPIAHLPGMKKPALAVSFSPIFYELDADKGESSVFKLPYKMIYAVVTQDSVLIYDTQNEAPLGTASNIHYRTLTDLTWSADGDSIIVSSADGFCSSIKFKETMLGTRLSADHKYLLPDKLSVNSKTKMESPSSKKRANNADLKNYLGKKKIKTTSPEEDKKKFAKLEPATTHKVGEVREIDNSSSTLKSGKPEVQETPTTHPKVQKKRITPTLIIDSITNDKDDTK